MACADKFMSKEEYKQALRKIHPDEPDEVLNVAWRFHDMKKAKQCIEELVKCTSYADLANNVIRALYLSCEINSAKALQLSFLSDLLPFTSMDRVGNPHSAAYHVRKMLRDENVQRERKKAEQRLLESYRNSLQDVGSPRTVHADIHISLHTDNEELIRKLHELLSDQAWERG